MTRAERLPITSDERLLLDSRIHNQRARLRQLEGIVDEHNYFRVTVPGSAAAGWREKCHELARENKCLRGRIAELEGRHQ